MINPSIKQQEGYALLPKRSSAASKVYFCHPPCQARRLITIFFIGSRQDRFFLLFASRTSSINIFSCHDFSTSLEARCSAPRHGGRATWVRREISSHKKQTTNLSTYGLYSCRNYAFFLSQPLSINPLVFPLPNSHSLSCSPFPLCSCCRSRLFCLS